MTHKRLHRATHLVPACVKAVRSKSGLRTFVFFNNSASQFLSMQILAGATYPIVEGLCGVATVVDVGANIGAASVLFAHTYPNAVVHAIEPSYETFIVLHENARNVPNIKLHMVGLHSSSRSTRLYKGVVDGVESSIMRSTRTKSDYERIRLHSAAEFIRGLKIDNIDILKIDTEGCELAILESLLHMLTGCKVIYIEYHSEYQRLRIDSLLSRTHFLYRAQVANIHRGEYCYINKQEDAAHKNLCTPEINHAR